MNTISWGERLLGLSAKLLMKQGKETAARYLGLVRASRVEGDTLALFVDPEATQYWPLVCTDVNAAIQSVSEQINGPDIAITWAFAEVDDEYDPDWRAGLGT